MPSCAEPENDDDVEWCADIWWRCGVLVRLIGMPTGSDGCGLGSPRGIGITSLWERARRVGVLPRDWLPLLLEAPGELCRGGDVPAWWLDCSYSPTI